MKIFLTSQQYGPEPLGCAVDYVLLSHAEVFNFKCDKCWILYIKVQYICTLLLFFWIVIVVNLLGAWKPQC